MPFGGFPTIRHNKVQDLTTSLFNEVSHYVAIEPSLQPVTTKTFCLASVNTTIMMLGCFTQMPPVTTPLQLTLNLLINVTRMPRSVNMVTELGILNMVFSPHWFSLQLGAWDVRPLFSTDV